MLIARPRHGTEPSTPSRDERRAREHELLALVQACRSTADPGAQAARSELIAMHQGYVRHLARGFAGAPLEDLVQAGNLGLIAAIDAYDPAFGAGLATFATKHIIGEMRQLVSSQAWTVHVPRRVQELARAVQRATGELTTSLGRAPTVRELADHLEVTTDAILDALEATSGRAAQAIEAATDQPSTLESGFAAFEDRQTVRALLSLLPERERDIVVMTYYDRMSQAQIAERLGISQMHVSRLHRRAMDAMRRVVET